MPISRRKPYQYKFHKSRTKKTKIRELCAVERAFAVGASVFGISTNKDIAECFDPPVDKSTIAKLVKRIRERADQEGISITDPSLYETLPGRGRPELLDDAQKKRIIEIVTQDRTHREKEPLQAIQDGDFDELPPMSVSTFENVMYEAGYARRKPGWKPPLTEDEMQDRYAWAVAHNPDKYKEGDGLGFNFRSCVYTDETPAQIGEQRGMQRAWFRPEEKYDVYVKHDRVQKYCKLQFYGAFTYNHKGPCHIYGHETEEEKAAAKVALNQENAERREHVEKQQNYARAALQEHDPNDRYLRSRKKQYTKKDDCTRGQRQRGGIDGYRHREKALKKVVPWINSLRDQGIDVVLLEDGAPAHTSRIAKDYLSTYKIDRLEWPGHSPDVNASEHAWPWIRRHITKEVPQSTCEHECRRQWQEQWENIPIEQINRWIDHVPVIVRRIIKHGGNNDFHDG